MKKGLSVSELMKKRYKVLDFQGELNEAFGNPEGCGVWFIWGNSGNGKSSFVVKLCKELLRFGRVLYNSLEEGSSLTLQNAFKEFDTEETKRRLLIINEDIQTLENRLSKKRTQEFVIIDSFQYSRMTYESYLKFKEKFPNKLIVFISHADGKRPSGRSAKSVMYDASLKIWIEGFKAFSKGRFIGKNGGTYTIWEEGANRYWNAEQIKN